MPKVIDQVDWAGPRIDEVPQLLTMEEAIRMTRYEEWFLRMLIRQGDIKAYQLEVPGDSAGLLRIDGETAKNYVDENKRGWLMSIAEAAERLHVPVEIVQQMLDKKVMTYHYDTRTEKQQRELPPELVLSAEDLEQYLTDLFRVGVGTTHVEQKRQRRRDRNKLRVDVGFLDPEVAEIADQKPLVDLELYESIEKAKLIVIDKLRKSGEPCSMKRRWLLAPKDSKKPIDLPPRTKQPKRGKKMQEAAGAPLKLA